MSELVSYAAFLKDREKFVKSGTRSGSEFNVFDFPSHTYFKILFYFRNGDSESSVTGQDYGLLAPTWTEAHNNEFYNYSTAWAYLKLNGDNERAEKLQQFVSLLSNINSESPWLLSGITGLGEAMERSINDVKVEEDRKKISIKCMKDTADNRIGTLLDLYKDIVWSWTARKEILPANLRKFDMGIYIFSSPISNLHADAAFETSGYKTSYKLFELHNCEIDYNSSKSAYGDLVNEEGNEWEYTIDIQFDNIYEKRYNEFMMREIGDMIEYDTNMAIEKSVAGEDDPAHLEELNKRVNAYDSDGALSNALSELIGAGKSIVSNKVKSLYLGNLYTISPKTAISQLKDAAGGHVFSAINTYKDYAEHFGKKASSTSNLGNLYTNKTISSNL